MLFAEGKWLETPAINYGADCYPWGHDSPLRSGGATGGHSATRKGREKDGRAVVTHMHLT